MPKKLPGSHDDLGDQNTSGSSGRFTDIELTALGQLANWWMNRLTSGANANPIESLIAGVSDRGTATTVGVAAVTIAHRRPLTNGSYLVHAYGIPSPFTGDAYSLIALAHFRYTAATGWTGDHTNIARTPAATTSTEIRAVLTGPPPGDTPALQIVGVVGLTIHWTINLMQLEPAP